jgi:trans-aconitate 2-methyltransferase
MRWDPEQYGRYADERGRPFVDLLARVGHPGPRRVLDLGCGPGNLTALLARRWPDAVVEGLDSSAEMIAAAAPLATAGLSFRVESVEEVELPTDADVVISNAALQWVPTHRELLRRWAAELPAGGWLAFQVPGQFDSPSHRLMRELAAAPRWAAALAGVLRHHDSFAPPAQYAELLLAAGLAADVWETSYLHVLAGPDPVLEWLRGTGLRPVLAALSPADGAEFSAEFAAMLRAAYPATPHGTVLPYRRVFAVGHK